MGHVPDDPTQLLAADVGHHQIDKNDIRRIGFQDIKGAQAILGDTHLMPALFQQIGNEFEHQGMVINDKNLAAHFFPCASQSKKSFFKHFTYSSIACSCPKFFLTGNNAQKNTCEFNRAPDPILIIVLQIDF